jgi:hypothetical protein
MMRRAFPFMFLILLLCVPVTIARLPYSGSTNTYFPSYASVDSVQSVPVLSVSPHDVQASQVGDTFTVYVTASNVSAADGAQVQLTYDPTVLNVTDVVEGPFLTSAGPTIVAQLYAQENLTSPASGEVYYASALVGAPLTVATGSGILLNVTFRAVSQGSTTIHLLSYTEGSGGSGSYFIRYDSNMNQEEIIPNLEDGFYGAIHGYSLIVQTFQNGVPVVSNVTLFDENDTIIQRANEVVAHTWFLTYDILSVQALIFQDGIIYASEPAQVNLTHNTEVAVDFLVGNLTVLCLDNENRPLPNCELLYSMGSENETQYTDGAGSDILEAYYGNWTVQAYWMGVPVGGANINIDKPETSLTLQTSVGDVTALVVDQFGQPTEANVTLSNEEYNFSQTQRIREPIENVTFKQIPLIVYNLTIDTSSGIQSYTVYAGQTRQIQIETLPQLQKFVYIGIGVAAGVIIGSLVAWTTANRKRKALNNKVQL